MLIHGRRCVMHRNRRGSGSSVTVASRQQTLVLFAVFFPRHGKGLQLLICRRRSIPHRRLQRAGARFSWTTSKDCLNSKELFDDRSHQFLGQGQERDVKKHFLLIAINGKPSTFLRSHEIYVYRPRVQPRHLLCPGHARRRNGRHRDIRRSALTRGFPNGPAPPPNPETRDRDSCPFICWIIIGTAAAPINLP